MNLGCVVYSKDNSTGGLFDQWQYMEKGKLMKGAGVARGAIGEQYEEEYSFIYTAIKGRKAKHINSPYKNKLALIFLNGI